MKFYNQDWVTFTQNNPFIGLGSSENMVFVTTSHAYKNVTNAIFSNMMKADLNWSLEATLPTQSRYNYKMLVACANDKKGFYLMNVVFFIIPSKTLLIAIKT